MKCSDNECGVVLESMDEALIMNGYGKGVHVWGPDNDVAWCRNPLMRRSSDKECGVVQKSMNEGTNTECGVVQESMDEGPWK
jgi:hypothetical protein